MHIDKEKNMENKWKIWLGLIASITIMFLIEKYYFDLGFFEQTKMGFLHDAMVFLLGVLLWSMGGIMGLYKEKK